MNNFSGVMKLAQLVVLLFLVSSVFGGYNAKFQKGAVREGTRQYGLPFVDKDDDPSHADRIAAGIVPAYGELPWQVTVYTVLETGDETTRRFQCGAVIISEWWVLSAAHCFDGGLSASDIILVVGNHYLSRKDSGEADFEVEMIINHPGWDSKENLADNDIALLKIKPSDNGQGIRFTKYVQPARLPDVGTSFPEGTPCLVSGWGRTGGPDTDVLLKTDSPIVNQARCKEVYAGVGVIVRERTICAGNVKGGNSACQGDSGGGLVCKIEGDYILAGIVSAGVPCARPDYITLFSLVPKFIPWIRSNMQD